MGFEKRHQPRQQPHIEVQLLWPLLIISSPKKHFFGEIPFKQNPLFEKIDFSFVKSTSPNNQFKHEQHCSPFTSRRVLERREREVEHGYASSLPGPFILDESYTQTSNHSIGMNSNSSYNNTKRLKNNNRKPQGNRSTHNELEKNRRAHLRNCLEKLKDIVPVGGDSSRHTTL